MEGVNKIDPRTWKIAHYVEHVKNPYVTLGCDKYLGAMGLYVIPEFRGEGIGLELLKAR